MQSPLWPSCPWPDPVRMVVLDQVAALLVPLLLSLALEAQGGILPLTGVHPTGLDAISFMASLWARAPPSPPASLGCRWTAQHSQE